jgi:hypothetical protein
MYSRIAAVLIALLSATFASAQATTVKPSTLIGNVVSINATTIALKTKDAEIAVMLTDKTEFKRVPPGKPSLSAATPSSASEIAVGDGLVVTGILSDDKRSIPARAVYLMTSSDISQQKQADAQRWATRGISGRVATANADTGQLSIEVRGLTGTQTITVTPKPAAKFRKYKQDSIQYSEALESKFADIQSGDMIRALGDRSSDGLSFAAEEIVTGAFKTVVGTIKSVDTATNQIVVTELQTNKDVIVSVGNGSALKRIPEEMSQRMSQMGGGAGSPAGQPGTQSGGRPGGVPPAGGQPAGPGQPQGGPGRGGMGGGARGGIDDMFERFPVITAAELKVGDMIAVSSSKSAATDNITAIKLLAGVEPFVRAGQAQAAGGGRGRAGQSGGFTIPGLDGFDFP